MPGIAIHFPVLQFSSITQQLGVSTNTKGYYQLDIQCEDSCHLTIAFPGYQPAYIDIEPVNVSVIGDVAMNKLQEEDLTTQNSPRQKDITFYWRTILGSSPSKRTIYAVNPDAVIFTTNLRRKYYTLLAANRCR